jgi:hypothetical protein
MKINYPVNLLKNYIFLLMIIGFPRVPNTEIPLAIIIAPVYFIAFISFLLKFQLQSLKLFLLLILGVVSGMVVSYFSDGTGQDIFFHLIIWIKILISIYFGFVVFKITYSSPSALLLWILTQSIFICASVVSEGFYIQLLQFISPRSAEVFIHIFSIRGLGFGLFHMDGSLILISAIFLYIYLRPSSISNKILLIIAFIPALLVARTGVIPFTILHSAVYRQKSIFSLLVLFSLLGLIALYLDIPQLNQAFELFIYILGGVEEVSSLSHLFDMYTMPTNLTTYLYGDGMYFISGSELTFYMKTDVGYMRLLYFAGLLGLALFISSNIYLLLYARASLKNNPLLARIIFGFIIIFIIINFKGIQSMPLLAYTFCFIALKEILFEREKKKKLIHVNTKIQKLATTR